MKGDCAANQKSWSALISLLPGGTPVVPFVTVNNICVVSYSDLNVWLGQQGIRVGWDQLVGIKALDCIEWYCLKHNLPDLTALVVHKQDQLPGDGFFRSNQIPMANRANLHNLWLQIAQQVIANPANYPIQPPPNLCSYGNC